MAIAKLPKAVIDMLASPQMREHHAAWHYVRDRWHTLSDAERQQFAAQHWAPPRLNPRRLSVDEPPVPPPDPGAGLDFLFMHRRMIEQVNEMLAAIQDPGYARVVGWRPMPWNHADSDWPMPPNYPDGPERAKDPAETARWKLQVEQKFESDAWLRTVSLDAMGSEIENGIHNWMHMHWANNPWFKQLPDQSEDDPRNDYLGSTYSSHVNEVFWKIHGWIDERISQWESATGNAANFSNSWEGPSHHMVAPMASVVTHRVLSSRQREAARSFFARVLLNE